MMIPLLKATLITPMSTPVLKACGCGLSYTRVQFDELFRLADWSFPWGDTMEMRNCTCGSTLALPLHVATPEEEAAYEAEQDRIQEARIDAEEDAYILRVLAALDANPPSQPPPAA